MFLILNVKCRLNGYIIGYVCVRKKKDDELKIYNLHRSHYIHCKFRGDEVRNWDITLSVSGLTFELCNALINYIYIYMCIYKICVEYIPYLFENELHERNVSGLEGAACTYFASMRTSRGILRAKRKGWRHDIVRLGSKRADRKNTQLEQRKTR